MKGKPTKVIHLALDPVTGPWSVMRELALAQLLGDGARVVAFRRRFIAPAASGKFSLLRPLVR